MNYVLAQFKLAFNQSNNILFRVPFAHFFFTKKDIYLFKLVKYIENNVNLM